jgi:hypothetical protein
MSKQPVRQNRQNRRREDAIAILPTCLCSATEAGGVATQPPLPARLYALLLQGFKHLNGRLRTHRRRKLQLLELQQLGEKRFVAIVRVGKQKFLIGGAATSVSLLAEIDAHRATVIAPRPLGQERA